jgi:DNA uptake protein ComE-like DNA-binding protein
VSTETGINPGIANDQCVTNPDTVDLNTATVEQLNALGSGMIGKRVIDFCPFKSFGEILACCIPN